MSWNAISWRRNGMDFFLWSCSMVSLENYHDWRSKNNRKGFNEISLNDTIHRRDHNNKNRKEMSMSSNYFLYFWGEYVYSYSNSVIASKKLDGVWASVVVVEVGISVRSVVVWLITVWVWVGMSFWVLCVCIISGVVREGICEVCVCWRIDDDECFFNEADFEQLLLLVNLPQKSKIEKARNDLFYREQERIW